MSETYPCPQCGEVLDVPTALAHQPVRCGACSRVFTPREPVLAREFDSEPPPTGKRRRRRESDEPIEAGSSNRRVIFIVLGIVGICGLLCCGGIGFFVFKMMNPDWQAYDSADGQFTANFPRGKVVPGSQPTGRGGETASGVVARRPMMQEEFFVYYVDIPNEVRKSEKVLHDIADGLMKQWPAAAEVRDRVLRGHAGFEAMDLCIQQDDDRYTQLRIVLANRKVYLVGVTGPGQPDGSPWVQEFLDSFQPTGDGKPKKNPFRGK